MSAEMNNKYDAGNFAKVLEEFSPQQEMRTVDTYLYGVAQAQKNEEFEEEVSGDLNRSETDRSGNGTDRRKSDATAGESSTTVASEEKTKPDGTTAKLSEGGEDDLRTHD